MFYKNFVYLCDKNSVSRSTVCKSVGLSENSWGRWADGSTPRAGTVEAIAKYFGVDYIDLLHTDMKNAPVIDESVKARQEVFDRAEMRVLFDAAKDVPASKIYEVVAMLEKYKEEARSK